MIGHVEEIGGEEETVGYKSRPVTEARTPLPSSAEACAGIDGRLQD